MNQKQKIEVLILLSILIIVGIVAALGLSGKNDSFQNEVGSDLLTLEEAKGLEIDTSEWKVYMSEDGVLSFKYSQHPFHNQIFEHRPHDTEENVVIGAPLVFKLGTTHAVSFYSDYLSQQGDESGSAAIFLETYILLFDAEVSEEELVSLSLSENIAPDRLSELTVLDRDLSLVRTERVDMESTDMRTHSYFAYLVKLDDGRHVYTNTRVTNRYSNPQYKSVDEELAKKIVIEILESMAVK